MQMKAVVKAAISRTRLPAQNFLDRTSCSFVDRKHYSTTMSTHPISLGKENLAATLNQYDNFLLDCDGVLYSTDHYTKFDNIKESIEKLRQLNKTVLFVTNNSMHARSAYRKKFQEYCTFDADVKDIYAVSYVAAAYLKHVAKITGKCYMIGTNGMMEELDQHNIQTIGHGADTDTPSDHIDVLLQHNIEPGVEAVLVGFDHHFGYNKLYKATSYLSDPACHYVATNSVETHIQLGPRHRQPLTGALLAAINTATRRTPTVIGKPEHHLMECIMLERPDLDLNKSIMIGDSLNSDIPFAHNSGMASAVVLTGASGLTDVNHAVESNHRKKVPTYILPSFSDIGRYF